MSFKVPTLDEMQAFVVAALRSLGFSVGSRFSYHWKRAKATSMVATDIHAHVDAVRRDVMPTTATGSSLAEWGETIYQLPKQGATPARKAAALRVVAGGAGGNVSVGDALTHQATSLRFQVNANAIVPPNSYLDVDVVGIDLGAQTRLTKGQQLQFTSPPAGIASIATLVKDLDEDGYDQELDPAYRPRVLARIGDPQSGGNQGDYVAWARQVTGIAAAYCYPNRAGVGTVDVVGLHAGTGNARTLTGSEPATLLAYLQSKAPAQLGASGGGLRVLNVITEAEVLEVLITPSGDPKDAFDWDDSTPLTVLSWNASTLTLQFTTDRPPSMAAGHRIILVGIASFQDGRQYRINALSGADSVILEKAPAADPLATDVVYSGGPLVDPVRDGLVGHLDGETVYAGDGVPLPASRAGSAVNVNTLRVLAEGVGPSNPGGKYGSWPGAIVRATILKIAAYVPGVRNATQVLPAADVFDSADYVFPNDDQIGLIVSGLVLVRKG